MGEPRSPAGEEGARGTKGRGNMTGFTGLGVPSPAPQAVSSRLPCIRPTESPLISLAISGGMDERISWSSPDIHETRATRSSQSFLVPASRSMSNCRPDAARRSPMWR